MSLSAAKRPTPPCTAEGNSGRRQSPKKAASENERTPLNQRVGALGRAIRITPEGSSMISSCMPEVFASRHV